MGTGMCSRRQKGLLQTVFCLVAIVCLGSGAFLYNHLQEKVKASEAFALKNKQQQEALSAQLQVVYEHRSRLERSLQKERGEHKKTKEDFLVYKLEAQEALNKEKQDSMNRYGALTSQHKILRNQHEDVKKQLLDLQLQHNGLKLEHRKVLETHNQKYAQLQREKEIEVVSLQDTVYKLREESKLLRKAHHDAHLQLFSAQAQMEEFRQLKETLQKMPSFKEGVLGKAGQLPLPSLKEQPPASGRSLPPLAGEKTSASNQAKPPLSLLEKEAIPGDSKLITRTPLVQPQGEKHLQEAQARGYTGPRSQGHGLFGQPAPPPDIHFPPAAWPQAGPQDGHIVRFTRMVNSVQNGNQDVKSTQGESEDVARPQAIGQGFQVPPAPENAQPQEKQPSTGSKQNPVVQSWQDLVNKVNAQKDEDQVPHYLQSLHLGARPEQAIPNGHQGLTGQQRGGAPPRRTGWEARKAGMDDELQMGMVFRRRHSGQAELARMQQGILGYLHAKHRLPCLIWSGEFLRLWSATVLIGGCILNGTWAEEPTSVTPFSLFTPICWCLGSPVERNAPRSSQTQGIISLIFAALQRCQDNGQKGYCSSSTEPVIWGADGGLAKARLPSVLESLQIVPQRPSPCLPDLVGETSGPSFSMPKAPEFGIQITQASAPPIPSCSPKGGFGGGQFSTSSRLAQARHCG